MARLSEAADMAQSEILHPSMKRREGEEGLELEREQQRSSETSEARQHEKKVPESLSRSFDTSLSFF